ncbi:MAG TPA: amidase family protein [Syntrophorhabdaceae bacterium]|nr:amidase family protein [Syntrophorhabdaceae bacterium]HQM80723.1 amidase family protein [Syntrophorhabdaceae bacterium]
MRTTADIFTYKNTSQQERAKGGPLAGKRVVIQPNMCARGWLTDAGSRALEGFIALEDATVVARLREAGAQLAGSARMGELGFGLKGDTGAQAIAAGEADIALITDTMGEARVAAAAHGLFAFKASFGVISRFGLVGLVPSIESWGVLARDLEDIIAVMRAVTGKDENDPSMPDEEPPDLSNIGGPLMKGQTAGVIKECLGGLSVEEVRLFQTGLERLEQAGFTMQEVSFQDFGLFRVVHNVIGSVEASSSAGKYDGVRYGHRASSAKHWNEMYLNTRGESFGTLIKEYLFQGAYFQFENYRAFENACRIRGRLVRDTADLFKNVSVLAFPTRRLGLNAAAATSAREVYDAFSLTLPANITGQPALHVPSFARGPEGDMGMQLAAPRLADAGLLEIGKVLASAMSGAERK